MKQIFSPKTQVSFTMLLGIFLTLGLSACEERVVRTELVVAPPVVADPAVVYSPSMDAMTGAGFVFRDDTSMTGTQMEAPAVIMGPGDYHNPQHPYGTYNN